ncbi:MAG: 3-methyl-2-oxobutanoate hydroxymethyltransferase [Candidatus Omnitrophota bacterium]
MKPEKNTTYSDKVSIENLRAKKGKDKITMLTCYDVSFARILDQAGIDIILVGDSMANVVLGLEKTKEVSFKEMFNHTKAVRKAVRRSLLVADMPYVSYQANRKKALYYARKFIEEAGADAVKIEWFKYGREVTKMLVKNKIAVMGHIGLTPQTADKLGGFRVQGKDAKRAEELINQAVILQDAGVFSMVIECVPAKITKLITQRVTVPTIGIGAGEFCDGQVLVLYDLLGLYDKLHPRFVRTYVDLSSLVREKLVEFVSDVKKGTFPSPAESFSISEEELAKLKDIFKN